MYNYHADLIWAIDRVLLYAVVTGGLFIIIYAVIQECRWNKRRASLLNLKKVLYEAVLAGKTFSEPCCGVTQLLDVITNRNRELVFFNGAEQKLIKDYFCGSQKITELERLALKSGKKWRRIECILGLGYLQESSVLKTLRKAIHSKDQDIAYFSMLAIGQIKTVDSAGVLLEFLKKNETSRFKVASMLESFPAGAADEVVKLLNEKQAQVRFWALKIISKFKPKHYLREIEALISDESADVRAAVCECLGQIGEKEAKNKLYGCLKDDSWLVRVNAIKALEMILGNDCLPLVINLINDGSLLVIDAVKGVMAMHIEASLPYIRKFFSGDDALAKRTSIEALEISGYVAVIFKHILSGPDNDRHASIGILEGMIKSGARFGFRTALDNLDVDSRGKVLKVINTIDTRLAEELLKVSFKEVNR